MIQKNKDLLIKELDNINDYLTVVGEDLSSAQEWLEYLNEKHMDRESIKESIKALKEINGDIAIAKKRLEIFKNKTLQIFDNKFKN